MRVRACSAPYLWGWLLKSLLVLAAVLPASCDCPTSCACYVPTEVHCTFRYLTAIPDHIQPAVERINLGYNSITALGEHDLSRLENLELLMLHSNTIHTIEDRAFQDLKSLQVLKMSYNKVKKINKKTFKGLDSLLRLHMDHNHIDFISPEAFYGLNNLQLVHLEGNRLQQLHPDTFVTLRHSQVFKISSVRNIHLSDNLLTTLPTDIFLGCSQLENVFLHGNPWACDCRMKWFPMWIQRNTGVLKCRRDRRYPQEQLCPVCENPARHHNRPLSLLRGEDFTCTKPWIQLHLKQRNISVDEGDFTPVSPKDFIAPLGSIQMNLTDHFHSDSSLSCTVQRPSALENLTQSLEEEEGNNATVLTAGITTYLVCNIDYEHIQQLWQILATYSDSPMRLERGLMLSRSPEMVYRYSQIRTKEGEEGIYTDIQAELKASPAWLMQGEVSFQLDRTTTTFSTLHIKYQSVVNLRLEKTLSERDRYSWTMIKRDNQTQTEHTVLTGGVAELSCQIQGEPKPLLEWILPDGSKVRAPYSSEDRRIIITDEGKLTLRGADTSDTGLYRCIATNYLDADILVFRVTVLSPDVEETEVNGVQLSRPLGGNLVFDCSSSGNPEASVHWILPDHTVLDKSHGNRKIYKNGTLLIQGLTERSRGFYRCLAANQLGVDLLVSQVTVTRETSAKVTDLDKEGSGMEMESKADPSLTEKTVTLTEIPSSSPSESRTITSDRPYPRLRSHGRGGRLGQRRRGSVGHRGIWSSRIFDKASRKVDPQKFAELMKKAQDGSNIKSDTEKQKVKHKDVNPDLSSEGEIGSGESQNENLLINVPKKPTIHDSEENESNQINLSKTTEITNSPTESTFTDNPSFVEKTDLNGREKTSKPPSDIHPVTLQLTVTDTSQETQLQFSGHQPAEPETSTGAVLSFTHSNITPMKDGTGPMEQVVHTDPEGQTTYTAVTTTERQQDEITFHTTQRIKSPRLPAGSTIISRQQIHIIPHKNGRGGGRKRTFQGRRRIIKPSRITNIQSFINKLKQPTVRKEGNASVPYQIELSTSKHPFFFFFYLITGCYIFALFQHIILQLVFYANRTAATDIHLGAPAATTNAYSHRTERPATKPDDSSDYATSANAPEPAPTKNPLLITNKEPFVSSTMTTTTTMASKVIHGRIPWERLFGGREKERILGRLRKPLITPRASAAAQTTTMTPTTTPGAMPTTTASSLAEPETLSPHRPTDSRESSLEDDYGELSSAEFTTLRPNLQHVTTTVAPFFSTTAEMPTVSQTLPSPPTVKPPSVNHLDETSSGSGGLPDNWLAIRPRPHGTRGHQGRRRRPFRGRKPFKKPRITKVNPTTTVASSTEASTMESAMETTQLASESVSIYKPSKKEDKNTDAVSTDQTSKETDTYEELFWSTFSSIPVYITTRKPLIISEYTPATTKRSYTSTQTRIHSSIRPPTQRNNGHMTHRPPMRTVRPTVQTSSDTVTVLTAEQGYINAPEPYSNQGTDKVISSVNHLSGNEATNADNAYFKPTTQTMMSRPKIIGGNIASFTVLSNSDAFLPCEAVGNPLPVTTWKRFSTSTGTKTFEVLSNGTLFIQNANIKDRGQYICLAENDHGSDKLLVTLSVVAYPSRILEPKVRELKSHVGNTVEMKCKAEGRPTPTISWILANRTQVRGQAKEKGRVSVTAEGTLVIEWVSVYDRGHYKCIASNPAGADTAVVRLQVVAAPPGIMEEKRQQLKASARQNLWLPCTGQGSPQPAIHWVLQDGTMVRSNRPARESKISMYENGTLHIQDVTPADSGKYECIATSSTGSERRVVTLTVQKQEAAPHILETSTRVTELSFGDQLRLNCSAKGDPEPRIMWRLPSKAVVDQWHRMGSRIQLLDNGTLIINYVSDKDTGDYLCVARNKIGEDLQLMRVSVSMKPAKIEPKLHGKKQVPYGNDLKVDCKASGAPKPEISWGLPDGTVVNSALQSDASSGGGRARRYTLFENGTLYLNQVSMSEEGDYTCYAENQVGKDEMHVHITVVTAAPRIRPHSQPYARVRPGGNIRFDCEALGEPKPKIFWILPTNDVIAASNDRYLMHVNGSLDIRDVKLIDSGEYVCMARNPAGENRKVYKLDIDGSPPVINGYRQNRTVIKDVAAKYSRKLIDCKAEGDPTPSITWIMPDNIFLRAPYFGSRVNVHHNGTLEIRNVRPSDTAEFICMARNDGGEAVMVVQLEVTSMLRRPIFRNPYNERIVSRIGKTTILNCSADGHPMPEIIWALPNGTRITAESDHSSRHHLGSDGTLIIYNPQKEDSGKYRCGAKNLMGYIEKLIILDIGQKPYILTRPKGVIRSASGDPLFLHCLSDGSPRPMIYWTIPGGHTFTRPQVLGRYQLFENGTLVVQDTTLHDRGNYICRARNNAGVAVVTVPVVIIAYPPRITTGPPPSVQAVTGAPIHLNCAAMGIPKPEINWELPNHSVLSTAVQGRPMGSELLHPQGTLIIQRPTISDSGTYKCLAKNPLGMDSKVTYVHVL
uniref:Immunoglobulin superfamily, member 10 n=1 Tax=Echeneis naucrates TaxID=173247 RepID=A0A665U362_ECHNA